MTIKGKRTGSLRKLTPEEARSQFGGGFVDRSFPEATINNILQRFSLSADHESFKEYLGFQLGLYRSLERDARKKPSIEQEVKLLEEMLYTTQEVSARLCNLPPEADYYFNEIGRSHYGNNFSGFKRQILSDLEKLSTLVVLSERAIESNRRRTGRPKEENRARFLASLDAWLEAHEDGLKKAKATDILIEVCKALQIKLPDDPLKVRKQINAWRKYENTLAEKSS